MDPQEEVMLAIDPSMQEAVCSKMSKLVWSMVLLHGYMPREVKRVQVAAETDGNASGPKYFLTVWC